MRSRSAVFNSRSVVVEPLYNVNDAQTFDTPESLRLAEEEEAAILHPADKLRLVEDRQSIIEQEIGTLCETIAKKMELAGKYAALAAGIEEAKKGALQLGAVKLVRSVGEQVGELYRLLKMSGRRLRDTPLRAPTQPQSQPSPSQQAQPQSPSQQAQPAEETVEMEVRGLMERVIAPFEGSFLYATLSELVMNHLLGLFAKYVAAERQIVRGKRGLAEEAAAKRRKAAMYQLDNRSREVVVKGLPATVKEVDVINAMKGFYGVRKIVLNGTEARIEFEEPWQTTKPMRAGLFICNKVSEGGRCDVQKVFPTLVESTPSQFPLCSKHTLPLPRNGISHTNTETIKYNLVHTAHSLRHGGRGRLLAGLVRDHALGGGH